MMATGCTGVRDEDGTRASVYDWPSSSKSNTDAVGIVSCASTMMTGSRSIMCMVIDAMRATAICKRFMDTVTMRKRGSVEIISRGVCVTSIRTLRSGVPGNGHAPFWSSGRRSDPPIDCNHHPGGSQQAFLTGLAHLYNLIPYQRRAQHAGQCGVEVEGGTVPTRDWLLNLQILTSGGFR